MADKLTDVFRPAAVVTVALIASPRWGALDVAADGPLSGEALTTAGP